MYFTKVDYWIINVVGLNAIISWYIVIKLIPKQSRPFKSIRKSRMDGRNDWRNYGPGLVKACLFGHHTTTGINSTFVFIQK